MQTFSSHVNGYYDVADQLPDLLRRAAEAGLAQQLTQKNAITTVAQFEARRAQVRTHFLGRDRWPARTNGRAQCPKCTGVLDRGDYTIEKLIYREPSRFLCDRCALRAQRGVDPRPGRGLCPRSL